MCPPVGVRSAGAADAASHLWLSGDGTPMGPTSVRAAHATLIDTWFESEGLGLSGVLRDPGAPDVDADGHADLAYMLMRPQDRGAWRWVFHLAADALRGTVLRPRTNDAVGDASWELPEPAAGEARPVLWFGDFTGDGVDDFWLSESTARGVDRTADAGRLTLYAGPLTGAVAAPTAPTPSPPIPSATVTATAATPTDTPTPAAPTAPPSATPTTQAPPLAAYLPSVASAWAP